jgi:hypothetical protein
MGRLLGISIAVAKSGFQHGGDAAGRQGRRFRLECKKYSDDTIVPPIGHPLSSRQLVAV